MSHYLSMDLRRLFKTRGFYVSIVISLVLLAIFAAAAYLVTGFAREMTNTEIDGMMAQPQVLAEARRQMKFGFFASFYLSHNSMLHLLLALFAAGFVSKDHQTGYFKNLLCIPNLRGKWLLSKLMVLLLAAVIFYAVFLLGCALVLLLYGNPLQVDVPALAAYFGMHLTVDMALFALICLVVALLQTRTAAVIIALLLSLNVQAIFYLLIDSLGILPFKLRAIGMMGLASRLPLEGGISSLMPVGTATTPAQLLPVSLGILLIAGGLSLLSLRRVDYRG